jgi:hypothetical protein
MSPGTTDIALFILNNITVERTGTERLSPPGKHHLHDPFDDSHVLRHHRVRHVPSLLTRMAKAHTGADSLLNLFNPLCAGQDVEGRALRVFIDPEVYSVL